jgi:hypothetical protein
MVADGERTGEIPGLIDEALRGVCVGVYDQCGGVDLEGVG